MSQKRTTKTTITVTRSDKTPKLEGYAARFYDGSPGTEYRLWDGAVERISPGAFRDSIKRKDDVAVLWNHDPSKVLGRTSSGTATIREDKKGLHYSVDVAETTTGRDALVSVERGDVNASSFAFEIEAERWEKERDGDDEVEVRWLDRLRLSDVSPVTYPAYTATSVSVRADEGLNAAKCSYEREQRRRLMAQRKAALELD